MGIASRNNGSIKFVVYRGNRHSRERSNGFGGDRDGFFYSDETGEETPERTGDGTGFLSMFGLPEEKAVKPLRIGEVIERPPIEFLLAFIGENGREIPRGGINNPHGGGLQYVVENAHLFEVTGPLLVRYEVRIHDPFLKGRRKEHVNRNGIQRETDVVFVTAGEEIVLVECSTSNGSARMRRQIMDAEDFYFFNLGRKPRGYTCKILGETRMEIERVNYDPAESYLNPPNRHL